MRGMKKPEGINLTTARILLVILVLAGGCITSKEPEVTMDELYANFVNPPAEARPFVRWWWNGDCIEVDELKRELDIMKAAGIGGVEVNPIAHPDKEMLEQVNCYEWLSPEWNERIKFTIQMAHEREMIVDLIMGSGWPFGGEFLKEDELLQGVGIRKLLLEGPERITLSVKEIWQLPGRDFGSHSNTEAPDPQLFFLQMIPQGAEGVTELVDLKPAVDDRGIVEISVPPGKHDLYIGTFQKAYRMVTHGAPGSRGAVVDHYDEKDVRAYMEKLGAALENVLGGELGDHIRALFCDSIELSGANITDDFFKEFLKRRGYRMEPFIPLVYYHPYEGYTDTLHYDGGFVSDIRRVRYDFNKTLVELFLERFTKTFDEWANEHGMQSRYQAYGMPWLMGILDGYRLVDIPESNNWLFSANAKAHGYWIWNKYCASAAHLSGSRTVSSEAMTNTRGVFRMPLSMVKKNDDFNFISGINHSVLHGFNYSPPEAGFPGWIRYGAYFSDQNSWWPYFRRWTDYNARLSSLFQQVEPVVDVAILTPEADIWSQWGLFRTPYYMNPWYHHDLWEGFSRQGITADYINEGVIRRATAENHMMKSENCTYQLVIVSSSTAMEPETAEAIRRLSGQGVRFLFVEQFPSRSPGYHEKEVKDLQVANALKALTEQNDASLIDPPKDASDVTSWSKTIAEKYRIQSSISIHPASEQVYVIKYRHGHNEIFFMSNQDDRKKMDFEIDLDLKGMAPWHWDPGSGIRKILPVSREGVMKISLLPLESLLIVLDKRDPDKTEKDFQPDDQNFQVLDLSWEIQFHPAHGEPFRMETDRLIDFGTYQDSRISAFGGQVLYKTTFDLEETTWAFLDLGPEKHITEMVLNGKNMGTRWWGRHLYPIDQNQLKQGENQLEIIYTTTLANYVNSLDENKVAMRWIKLDQPESMGLTSEIRLLKRK